MTLAELSQNFSHIADRLPAGEGVAYVDIPVHKNAGDILIFLGTMEFFRRHSIPVAAAMCTLDASPSHLKRLDGPRTVVLHGGGNLGDIYPRPQKLREAALRSAPAARALIFPQSIQFHDDARLAAAAEVFQAHPKLTVFTRDKPSHDIAKAHFSPDTHLSQDMAHTLYEWLAPLRSERPREDGPDARTLYFLRRDMEVGAVGETDLEPGASGPLDWPDLLTLGDKLRIEAYRKSATASRVLPRLPLAHLHGYEAMCRALILRLGRKLVQYDHIVTSRLHGAIFGLLLGRRVTIIDNSYGKNSRYADCWLQDIPTLDVAKRSDRQSAGL